MDFIAISKRSPLTIALGRSSFEPFKPFVKPVEPISEFLMASISKSEDSGVGDVDVGEEVAEVDGEVGVEDVGEVDPMTIQLPFPVYEAEMTPFTFDSRGVTFLETTTGGTSYDFLARPITKESNMVGCWRLERISLRFEAILLFKSFSMSPKKCKKSYLDFEFT